MMSDLATQQSSCLIPLDLLEKSMLSLPQAECPVVHHFGPGIYIREVHIPAGALAIGHAQKFKHLNVLMKGTVAMVDDGQIKILKAPMIFIGQPGRKIGYVIEDVVWQNIYSTNETDVETLEEIYLDKSTTWIAHHRGMEELLTALRVEDREDFEALLKETGFTAEQVRQQSENLEDQTLMPSGAAPKATIRDSYIEGKGVFLSSAARPGEHIGPARINSLRTPLGRFTNHAKYPNAYFAKMPSGDIYLIAAEHIQGCVGGDHGEEVTVDYRQALSLADRIGEI